MLKPGQRWRSKNPPYIVEVIKQVDSDSADCIFVGGCTAFQPGKTYRFYLFPLGGLDENNHWEYLRGQDRPAEC